ncbi:ribbon-helix-helix domain-containing protein [Sphingomonas sp. SUN019]|uniref:ribbon-helix-helix domain-containing protein n=1 Tax=Sphingomonas sp. SUN019 TaxID=2937788 RepID=UPI002164BB62|nr:ribbon-helix-helix domain-containing protein [Sphingomonas sp. SUN019]UVO52123.1 ribbon-helix-helix domain-containing protein [Sphingomonas sp. SUN019]
MLGVRLDSETERALESLSRRTKRPKSQIARDAIRAYVARSDAVSLAREEWRRISERERDDPEVGDVLDGAARELDLP